MGLNGNHDGYDRGRRLALLGFLAAAGFYLWTEHRAHVLGVLPYLVLAACPLMHLFHHHGHRHAHRRNREEPKP